VYRSSVDEDHATLLHPQNCSLSPKITSKSTNKFKNRCNRCCHLVFQKKIMQGGPEKDVPVR